MYTSVTALWLLASGVWLGGAACFHLLHPYLSAFECVAAAAPVGLTLSTWLGVLLKSYIFASSDGLTPGLGFSVALVQTAIAAAVTRGIYRAWDKRASRTAVALGRRLALPLVGVVLPLSLWFTFIHYTHSLLPHNEVYNVGGTVYGDMPFHLMIINSLLFGVNVHAAPLAGVPLKAAFFTDADLVYPYIPDYHTALVAGAGSTLHFALFSAGSLLCASFLLLLFFLALRLTSSVWAASVAVLLALFCGGTGAFTWLLRDTTWAGLRAVDHILEDSVSRQITICWFSLPAHILLPQRTTQFAYPVAILSVIVLYRACQALQQRSSSVPRGLAHADQAPEDVLDVSWAAVSPTTKLRLFAAGGFITGLLPQLQAHSFVSVGIVMLVVAGLQVLRCAKNGLNQAELRELVKVWTVYGVCAFSVGLPQSLMYFGKVSNPGQSFIRLLPIWMDFPEGNPLALWFHAVGFFTPLHFLAIAWLPMAEQQRLFQYGFAAVFVVGNLVIFQPWVLDNTKVFYVWVFGAAAAVAMTLEQFWRRGASAARKPRPLRTSNPLLDTSSPSMAIPPTVQASLWKAAAVALFLSLIFSGVLCCFNESLSFNRLYDKSDMEVALWFQENTPPDARVAISTTTYSQHMRPSAALAGRQIMSSYWGWISNHGMPNYAGRNADMINMLAGSNDGREQLLNYNVTHIVIDRFHLSDFDMQFLNAVSYRVAQNEKFFIHEVAPYEALVNIVDCIPPHAPAHADGVDPEECEAHGCMWVPNGSGDPYCQVPPVQWGRTEAPEDCHQNFREACNHSGCSWFEGFAGPYCQQPCTVPGRPAMPIVRRLATNDCGWLGVTQENCESRGCHWRPDSGGPWCQMDGEPTFEDTAFNRIHALI